MKKWLFLLCFFLLSACANDKTAAEQNLSEQASKQELKEKLLELTELFGSLEAKYEDIDKAVREADSLGLKGEERDNFVRSYLIFLSAGKKADANSVKEDSELRRLYEDAWKKLAEEKYGVAIEEEALEELIETYIDTFEYALYETEETLGTDMFYLAEALGYSLHDFFHNFDRHHFEKWLIGQELFPILKEGYGLEDNLAISERYRLEVIDYIVESFGTME